MPLLHADPWYSPFLPVTLLGHNTMPRAPSWTLGDVLSLQSVSDVPAGNLEEKLEAHDFFSCLDVMHFQALCNKVCINADS